MISWLSLSGGALLLDGANFILRTENSSGGLRARAMAAGFIRDDPSREFVFRAPLGWDLARAMRKWPGTAVIEVEPSSITQAEPAPAPAPEPEQAVKPGSNSPFPLRGANTLNPRHFFIRKEIDRDRDGGFSPKMRFQENRAAIETLKQIEAEGRDASPEEKSILVKFNGWGGLSCALATQYPAQPWHREARAWVKEHLSADEIKAAGHSTLNAHYTPPEVVREVWAALDTLANRTGIFDRAGAIRVLEPSAGVGNFLGLMPKQWADRSHIVGVELDPITARIAHKIYPDADIRACGFEDIRVPDGYFDLVLTNVPFGDYGVNDPEFIGSHLSIHDYFILKAIRKSAPGGLVAVMTSAFTMDKLSAYTREQIAKEAGLVGAVRLPETSMSAQAGTRVTADLLIFSKKPSPRLRAINASSWTQSEKRSFKSEGFGEIQFGINDYFVDHPEQVLGTLHVSRGIHGTPRLDVSPKDGDPWADRIASSLTIDALSPVEKTDTTAMPAVEPAPETETETKAGAVPFQGGTEFFVWSDGNLYRRYAQVDGEVIDDRDGDELQADEDEAPGIPVALTGKALARVKGMVAVRDAMNQLVDLEVSYADDAFVARAMQHLNESYDKFATDHGSLNAAVNRRLFREDPSAGRLAALEIVDPESGAVSKADIFRTRIILRTDVPDHIDTPIDALDIVMAHYGKVDLSRVSALCEMPINAVTRELLDKRAIFRSPVRSSTQDYEIAARYLSGNVRKKLDDVLAAKEMGETDEWDANIDAIRAVLPKEIGPADISVTLGAVWIPGEVFSDFAMERLNLNMEFTLNPILRGWDINLKSNRWAAENTTTWGTPRRSAESIVDCICNHRSVTIYDSIEKSEGAQSRIVNEKETMLAENKLSTISEEFASWIWSNRARTEQLVNLYNTRFNSYVAPNYDGKSLTFPGMSASVKLRQHQKNAVLRSIQEGNTIFGHQVGTGKTYAMVAAAMEWVRVGKATKVGICVPNHMIEQIERETLQLYPNARILVIHKEDLSRDRRARFLGKVANNVYDIVVMTHSVFTRIPVPKEFESQIITEEVGRFKDWLSSAESAGDGSKAQSRSIKAVNSRIAKMKARRKSLLNELNENKDRGLNIDDLGIDALFIDEAHNFKNLEADTGRSSELASGITGSQRALDLYMKTKWLYARRGDISGVIFSTGTPVSNNLLEIFNLQRYIQPEMLSDMGLDMVAAWASTFLSPKRRWEPDPGGTGFVLRTRFVLVNAPELLSMLRVSLDVVSTQDAGIKVPQVETHNVVAKISERQSEKMVDLADRVIAIRERDVDPSEDNILKIISEGRQLSLDPRLLDLEAAPVSGESGVLKWEMLAENVHKIWEKESASGATQIVFCDLGTPSAARKHGFNIYDAVRDTLVERGIPAKEVAFIHEANTDKAKGDLLARVRAGGIRVIIGSTMKMGEGTNMQDKAVAIHHLDAPWRPSDIEQRDGRIVRQGNRNEKIIRYIYTTKGVGFDEYTWTVLKTKAEAFSLILRGEPGIRVFDNDVDPSYAETVAITTGNPLLIEKLDVEREITRLRVLARGYDDEQWRLRMALGGLKDRLEESETSLERLKTLPNGSSRLWSIDYSGFSFKEGQSLLHDEDTPAGLFDVPRTKMLEAIRELSGRCADPEQISRIKAISCGSVPVVLKQEIGLVGKRISTWYCGEMAFTRSADLEDTLLNRNQFIRDRLERIAYLRGEIAKMEGVKARVNPHNETVAKLLLQMTDIEQRMMEYSQKKSEEAEQPGTRFTVR